ncbi:MAG: toll/interleukin-1 receptor domain-containing protein [Acidobacteriota bacterium]
MVHIQGNPDLLDILGRGAREWNRWRDDRRKARRAGARPSNRCALGGPLGSPATAVADLDLRAADLRRADLAGVDLSNADLRGASFAGANLRGARFTASDLRFSGMTAADLSGADLAGANLQNADLGGAVLADATLRGATLAGSNLWRAVLDGTCLEAADLAAARLGGGRLVKVDLSGARALHRVHHHGPSHVTLDTLEWTAHGLRSDRGEERRRQVVTFLAGAGAPEALLRDLRFHSEVPALQPAAFIAYAGGDRDFAALLDDRLREAGLRAFRVEHGRYSGNLLQDLLSRGIRPWDRILLCCSRSFEACWTLRGEMAQVALGLRRKGFTGPNRLPVLVPLGLEPGLFDRPQTSDLTADGQGIHDFSGWDLDRDRFETPLGGLLQALRDDPVPKVALPLSEEPTVAAVPS